MVRVDDTTRALGDLARHVRQQAAIPFVGITGSVGKTTTKDMTAALLETRGPVLRTVGNLNNHWGLPLTVLGLGEEHTAAVLEMGMSAPGELRQLSAIATPDVAVITRVAAVHLEFFPTIDAIADAKAEILEGLAPGGTAVLNGDDPRLRRVGEAFGGRVVWFGRDRRFDVSAERWRGTAFGMRFDLRVAGETVDVALPLAGPHFVENFLAAAATAHVLGIDPGTMARWPPGSLRRGTGARSGASARVSSFSTTATTPAPRPSRRRWWLSPWPPPGAGWRSSATCWSSARPVPPCTARAGAALVNQVDAVVGVGPLSKEIVAGAREAGLAADAAWHFEDAATAGEAVADLVRPGDAVLVKASRGLQLEKVVDAIVVRFGGGEA